MALCLQPIQNPFCVPMAGFVLWMHNLHRWQLYQPALVHHFVDVCLEDLKPPASIFWWMASFLHCLYPCPELRLRIARRMMDIAGVAKEQKIVRKALNVFCGLKPVCQCLDRQFLAEFIRIVTSDEALFSLGVYKAKDMADFVLADDLARLFCFQEIFIPCRLETGNALRGQT